MLLEQPVVIAASVLAVANDGMVDVGEMLANLPESSCPRFRCGERVALLLVASEGNVHFARGKPAIVGGRVASRARVARTGQRIVDRAFFRLRPSAHDGDIALAHAASHELLAQ